MLLFKVKLRKLKKYRYESFCPQKLQIEVYYYLKCKLCKEKFLKISTVVQYIIFVQIITMNNKQFKIK